MYKLKTKENTALKLYSKLNSALSHYKGAHLWLETPFFPLDETDRKRVIFFLRHYDTIKRLDYHREPLSSFLSSCNAAITAIENEKGRHFYKQWLAHELISMVKKHNMLPAVLDNLKIVQQ
jgi:hypothetical protein